MRNCWALTVRSALRIHLAIVLLAVGAHPARAQAGYTFTRIADTVHDDAGLGGPNCAGLGDSGKAIVVFVPAGTGKLQLWGGDGTPGSFAVIETAMYGICASINELDETAYLAPAVANTAFLKLVRNSGGLKTTLASYDGTPGLNGAVTYLPSLSRGGSAVFVGNAGFSPGVFIGPAGPAVYNPLIDPPLNFVSPASMNDSQTVVFAGTPASGPRAGVGGIYRGGAVPLLESGDSVSGGHIMLSWTQRPVINNAGTVAFTGRLDVGGVNGIYGVYTTTTGNSVSFVGTSPVDRLSINDAGTVAYRRTTSGGAGSGLFIGRPGAPDVKVINQGDPLDGSTVRDIFIWEEAINNSGQIAFIAHLADGRVGLYRADPPPANLLVSALKAPSAAAPGSTIDVRDSVKNSGSGAAGPSTTRFWLSKNKLLDGGDTPLGARSVAAIAAGATNLAWNSLTVPNTVPGSYYLLAQADADATVAESNESDNLRAKALLLGPDLQLATMVFAPTSPTSTSPTTITVTVKNVGGQTAGASKTRLYRSVNGKLDASDSVLSELPLAALAAGATATQSATLTLPAGTYYVLAVCDATNVVIEAKETNNMKKASKVIP